ncbi:MAG: AbrB/MazE/SpoVT family DNA-binding domain-containing protein [Bacillota bacterium]
MKALGIIRPIDKLGRVVIPIEVRRAQGWEEGTPMEMFASENGLVMREYGNPHEHLVDVLEVVKSIVETDLDNHTVALQLEHLIEKYSIDGGK